MDISGLVKTVSIAVAQQPLDGLVQLTEPSPVIAEIAKTVDLLESGEAVSAELPKIGSAAEFPAVKEYFTSPDTAFETLLPVKEILAPLTNPEFDLMAPLSEAAQTLNDIVDCLPSLPLLGEISLVKAFTINFSSMDLLLKDLIALDPVKPEGQQQFVVITTKYTGLRGMQGVLSDITRQNEDMKRHIFKYALATDQREDLKRLEEERRREQDRRREENDRLR